ncbi:MAG: hypothetical protein QOG77_1339 [Solirubrobacteraceae bacterium]|nr:hypothetical protein [Solirubrobacteraceae bacterium]
MSALAQRIAAQGLANRDATTLDVLRSWAVQDSPPGAAAAAVAARAETVELDEALAERSAVALYNARTATAILPAGEAAAFGTALLPDGDAELKALLGQALPGHDAALEKPVALAVEAISDALDGRTLSRDELHAELRGRLPQDMLPWCEGCQSHHARRGLLVMAGLHGRLCLAGRAGRQPAFARTDQWIGWAAPPRAQAGAELVRRFRAAYPPSDRAAFAAWAGIGTGHARRLWQLVEEEEPDADPPAARGVRLLAPGDPLLLARDRELLAPDEALHKRLFKPSGSPGLVLVDGEPAGLWRARKKGKRLEVEVEPLGTLNLDAVQAEAERLAPLRGCTGVAVGSSRS